MVAVGDVFEIEAGEVGFGVVGLDHALQSGLGEGFRVGGRRRCGSLLGGELARGAQKERQNGGDSHKTREPHEVDTVWHK